MKRLLFAALGCFVIYLLMKWAFSALPDRAVLGIASGTDASTGTGVMVALARALPNNPKAVLHLDRRPFGPSLYRICTLPFIEPDYAFIQDYGERTLAALREVDDPYLLDSRDVCAQRLQERLDHCEKVYKSGKWKC